MNEVRFAGPRAALRVSLCHPTAAIARCCASSPPSPSVEPALRGQNAVGKPCRSPAVSGKKALPNAWWCAGIGRSARQQEHSLKHGLYTREAIEERRQLRALMRQSRMLIQDIE
jgi:hypothetical protein